MVQASEAPRRVWSGAAVHNAQAPLAVTTGLAGCHTAAGQITGSAKRLW